MGERCDDPSLHIGRVLKPDSPHADSLRHGGEIWVSKVRPGGKEAGRFLLELNEAEGAVVEHNHFHRQAQLRQARGNRP